MPQSTSTNMTSKNIFKRVISAIALCCGLAAGKAQAVPLLQLYLEGGTYDTTTETWVGTGGSNGEVFRLWAIGNVDGPGSKGSILDVKLSAVYDSTVGPLTISITPSTTGGYMGFFDPSTPGAPTLLQTVSDGSLPQLGDGSNLPDHGQYGPGRTWQEFSLGDFTLTDSPVGDFITGVPTPGTTGNGQINVYDISVSNFDEHPFTLHFDLYDHYIAKGDAKYVFAPFSHDGENGGGVDAEEIVTPEPASATMLVAAAFTLFGAGWRKRRKSAQLTA